MISFITNLTNQKKRKRKMQIFLLMIIQKKTDISNEKSDIIEMENQIRSLSEGYTNKYIPNFLQSNNNYSFYNLINFDNKYGNPFGDKRLEICEKNLKSPYRNFPFHSIKSFIAKEDDDLRQKSLSM